MLSKYKYIAAGVWKLGQRTQAAHPIPRHITTTRLAKAGNDDKYKDHARKQLASLTKLLQDEDAGFPDDLKYKKHAQNELASHSELMQGEDSGWSDDMLDDDKGDTFPTFPTTDKYSTGEDEVEWSDDMLDDEGDTLPTFPTTATSSTSEIKVEWSDDMLDDDDDEGDTLPAFPATTKSKSSASEIKAEWSDDMLDDDRGDTLPAFPTTTESSTSKNIVEWSDDMLDNDDDGDDVLPTFPTTATPTTGENIVEWSEDMLDNDEGDDTLPEFPTAITSSTSETISSANEQTSYTGETKAQTHRPKRTFWTSDEISRLQETIRQNRLGQHGRINWPAVLQHFPHRTREACIKMQLRSSHRHQTSATNPINKQKQQKQQGIITKNPLRHVFLELVWELGEHDWRTVSSEMERQTGVKRSPADLAQLWRRYLCPKARTAPVWTPEDTEALGRVCAVHGEDPVFLAYRFFPQYSPTQVQVMIRRRGTSIENMDPRVQTETAAEKLRERLLNVESV